MNVRNIVKDRNKDSSDSTLKVNYIVDFSNRNTPRCIKLNPILYDKNFNQEKTKFRISDLRKEEFNSFSNENMDFFRLDHLSECDRNNYHNVFMDKLKPINRSANFQKFNEIGKDIKYLDYLKENYLLNQNKKIVRNILSHKEKENIKLRKNYYTEAKESLPEINNRYSNNIINNDELRKKNFKDNYDINANNNINNNDIFTSKLNEYKREMYTNRENQKKEILINKNKSNSMPLSQSNRYIRRTNNSIISNKYFNNSYISNINDYSIQEGDKNLFPEKNKYKLYPVIKNNYTNDEQIRRLYNIKKRNFNEGPFYLAYNERNKNGGFYKKGVDISKYERISQNKLFFRNNNEIHGNEYRDMKNVNVNNFHKKI